MAYLPQLYHSYTNQTEPDSESLSTAFLIKLFRYFYFSSGFLLYSDVNHVSVMAYIFYAFFSHSADLSNLLVCIFTDQLPMQKVTAVYHLITDIVVLSCYRFISL